MMPTAPNALARLGYRSNLALVLLVALSWPAWLPHGAASARPLVSDALVEQATLETREPEVQWSPAGADPWHAVSNRQTVQTGDRVRTGAGAAARLVYFEGTMTELGPDTGLLVQRLERSAN